MFLPGWGMHLADIPEAQGDLIRAGRRSEAAQGSIQNNCSTAEIERLRQLDR